MWPIIPIFALFIVLACKYSSEVIVILFKICCQIKIQEYAIRAAVSVTKFWITAPHGPGTIWHQDNLAPGQFGIMPVANLTTNACGAALWPI